MERGGAEGLVMALQGVIAAWLVRHEDRVATKRRRGFRALSFPAPYAARDGGDATPACC